MMCPVLVYDANNELSFLTGTGGATRIPFSIGQMLYNKFKLEKTLTDSVETPLMYKNGSVCYAESGLNYKDKVTDMDIKTWEYPELLFGGLHSIDLTENKAKGDVRREGSAIIKYK